MLNNSILSPFQLLELNVISAQDLAPVSRKIRTYAIAWIHPDRKLSTRVDIHGHNNPTWNDKFVFRVDNEFLHGETSAVMIEIYALHWFRDIHVGTVRIIIGNLIPPTLHKNQHAAKAGTRFVALQVRRASGRPQGILNIGVAILDSSMRSMPLYTQLSASAVGFRDLVGKDSQSKNDDSNSDNNNQFLLPWYPKPELRRTKSDWSSMMGPNRVNVTKSKASSMISGSEIVKRKTTKRNNKKSRSKVSSVVTNSEILVNNKAGSTITDSAVSDVQRGKLTAARKTESHNIAGFPYSKAAAKKIERGVVPQATESDIGPSVSEVAANIMATKAKHNNVVEEDSEMMEEWSLESSMECLQSKLERWRTELPPAYDRSELDIPNSSIINFRRKKGHRRRRTEDGKLFSCFGKICGVEISIVCGGDSARRKRGPIKRSQSMDYSSFL